MSKTIAKLLDPNCVLLNCTYDTSFEVINAVSKALFIKGYVHETFAQAAIEREGKLPTGLPLAGGINAAIPHTDIEHVIKPALGMATLRKPVDFQNMILPDESVPVRLVFVLALEQPKAQIEMLQEVASVIQNTDLVEKLMDQKSFEGIIQVLEKTG